MKKLMTLTTSFVAAALIAGLAMAAPKGLLDGKKYSGSLVEVGKKDGQADTLIFEAGTFRSVACDQYGYKAVPYQAKEEGGVIRFTAVAENAEGRKNQWSGTVKGEHLEAKLISGKMEMSINASLAH